MSRRLPVYRLLRLRIFTRRSNTTYTWSYANNGTHSSGEFTTNEYGQASFEVPEDTDCSKVDVKVKGDGGNALPVSSPEN